MTMQPQEPVEYTLTVVVDQYGIVKSAVENGEPVPELAGARILRTEEQLRITCCFRKVSGRWECRPEFCTSGEI